eukprot:g8303.t1
MQTNEATQTTVGLRGFEIGVGCAKAVPSASSALLSRPAPSSSSSSGPNPLVHASKVVAQIAPREMVKELVRRFKITEEEAARQWLAQRVPGEEGNNVAEKQQAPRGSSKDDRAPPSPGRSLAEAPRGDRPGEGGARQAAAAAKRVAEEGEKLRKREAEAAARKQQREEAALKRKEEAAAKRAKVEEDKQLRARMAAADQSEARNVKRLQAQECAAGKAAEAEKSRLLAMEKAASEKKRLAEEEKRQQRRAALDTWWGAIPTKPSPELSAAFARFFGEESS